MISSSTTISSSSSSVPLVSSSSTHHTGGHITCVIIGDSGVGKSSLVVSYTTNDFPTQYIPTAFDNYSVDVSAGTRLVHFDICDTGGKVNRSIMVITLEIIAHDSSITISITDCAIIDLIINTNKFLFSF
jgi:small GTP-binding protein